MTILGKLFLYLARFISREAAEGIFQNGSGKEYDEMERQLLSMDDSKRIRDIRHYIFGIDSEAVQKKISNVRGMYLFVDYAAITSSINSVDVKDDSFHIAMTVACPLPENSDQMTEMIAQDKSLAALSAIRRSMRDDFELNAVFWCRFPSVIQPFSAPALAHSIGWTMEFDVGGIDIV
ncbi:MAG: hypothetical protein ACI3ZQ_04985 [Candidatus Cryptobacteroides sp.]